MATTAAAKKEKQEQAEDVIDILEPKAAPVERTLTDADGNSRTYTQKSLTFFNKTKFMGMVGETLDKAMKDGMNLSQAIDSADTGSLRDIESFLGLVTKVARYAPDFLKDCYVLWLGVPANERVWAAEALDELTDEEGIDIIETFIDQNWEAMESFFTEHARTISKRVEKARKANDK